MTLMVVIIMIMFITMTNRMMRMVVMIVIRSRVISSPSCITFCSTLKAVEGSGDL